MHRPSPSRNTWGQKQLASRLALLRNICMCIVSEVGPESRQKFHLCFPVPYVHRLKLILLDIFNDFVYEMKFHSVEFSNRG